MMPKRQRDNEPTESQAERFKRTAREHGVELDEERLAETLRQMAQLEREKKERDQRKD